MLNKPLNNRIKLDERHTFHLVDRSPWPIVSSWALFSLVIYFVGYLQNKVYISSVLFNLALVILAMSFWFADITRESYSKHTLKVEKGLRYGMALFIVSEVMFFFSFFWAFFHSSLTPAVTIGCMWPPQGTQVFNFLELPLVNTIILLTSGVTITVAHRALRANDRKITAYSLLFTILLGLVFTLCQGFEYTHSPFSIKDGIYGSLFFMCTGFHGCHVIIGTIFLIVCFIRHLRNSLSAERHFGFEAAAWYWHFVDVVWLFLYVTIYWWGS